MADNVGIAQAAQWINIYSTRNELAKLLLFPFYSQFPYSVQTFWIYLRLKSHEIDSHLHINRWGRDNRRYRVREVFISTYKIVVLLLNWLVLALNRHTHRHTSRKGTIVIHNWIIWLLKGYIYTDRRVWTKILVIFMWLTMILFSILHFVVPTTNSQSGQCL